MTWPICSRGSATYGGKPRRVPLPKVDVRGNPIPGGREGPRTFVNCFTYAERGLSYQSSTRSRSYSASVIWQVALMFILSLTTRSR
jgi:hypothetical protein